MTSLGSNRRGRARTRVGLAVATGLSLLQVGFLAAPASAAPGDRDMTFGTGGIVTTALGGPTDRDEGNDMVIQPDGKIVVAGEAYNSSGLQSFGAVRYHPDGTLDASFDGDGIVQTSFFTSTATQTRGRAFGVAVQADLKVVVAGFARGVDPFPSVDRFTLVRYNPDGSLDTTFDGDGVVMTAHDDPSRRSNGNRVLVDALGRIVIGGSGSTATDSSEVFLQRYNSDGSLDTSFDGDGKVTTPASVGSDELNGLALQPDGKIVGAVTTNSGAGWAVVRYNEDGSLDAAFDGDGMLTTDVGPERELPRRVAIQADGRIVVVGFLGAADESMALVRYNNDGSLDTSFDGDGIVITDLSVGSDRANGVVIQADGKIVTAGESIGSSNTKDYTVVRYSADGSLDATFGGGDGVATTDIDTSNSDFARAVALQADGRIVVAGTGNVAAINDFAVVRYKDGVAASLCPGMMITNIMSGTPGDDTLVGTSGRDLILGGDGNDTITGAGKHDCIFGGAGDDTIAGGAGTDLIDGGADNDTILIQAGDVKPATTEKINARQGADTIDLGAGVGPADVTGTPPTFSVSDPASGGSYSVVKTETITDS